jgi:microcystin-dependent protein
MRGPYTSNGLELLYTGEFAVDFAAHTVVDLAARFNSNMLSLDEALAILADVRQKVDILVLKGHVAGVLNGGLSGVQPVEPEEIGITRLIHNRLSDEDLVPSLAVPVAAEDVGLFKNELSINSYGGGDLVGQSPGLWLRVGGAETAEITDKLLRIGKALVTDDLVSVTEPSVAFDDTNVIWTGELWLRNTDKAFFVHDGEAFFRVTPVEATELVSGIVRHATDIEVLAGVEEEAVVSPADLTLWKEDLELVSRTRHSTRIYVDGSIGDDSLSNDGKDPRYPFLTPNRAVLEVARQSFVAGFDNDQTNAFTIICHPNDYVIDNRPGSSNYALLTRQTLAETGPINKVVLAETVTNVSLNALGQTVLTVAGAVTAGLTVGVNVWNSDATKQGIVVSLTNTELTLRQVKGAWAVNDQVTFADYSVFNSPDGGVIIPRGTSIIGLDLRKTILRPRFLGNLNAWIAAISGTECICSPVGNTAIFLLTGDSYVANLTFADNVSVTETHHLCVAFNFAKSTDLTDSSYGYYPKVFQVLGNTVAPAIVLSEFQAGKLEINIVSDALSNSVTDGSGFRLVDTVKGASPYISNCTLRSRFGMRGIVADGSRVGGFKSIVTERFTIISMQSDGRAFDSAENAPGGKTYKEQWRHVAIEAINDAYIQAVSCFTIAPAVHYRTREGGEISSANCFVNFGDVAFDAIGHSITKFPQDQNAASIQLIPPKPITSATQSLALGSFKYDVSSSTRLYVYDDELTEERINPFSLQGGETLYLKNPEGIEYTAELVDTAPFFEQDGAAWYIKVKGNSNTIYSIGGEDVDSFFISVKRTPDTRAQADRIYWLEVSGLDVANKRSPQRNYALAFNTTSSPSYSLETPLWIAAVRDRDSSGNVLGTGVYQIALMSAAGTNDAIADLYPPLNLDVPQVNPATSKTYQALATFLTAIGMGTNDILNTLVESASPRLLLDSNSDPQEVSLDFLKPSTIRSFGTGLEWVGYGNYSSALPKYQDYEFNVAERFAKIKRERDAGRVYNVGMTDDGKFIVGNSIVDVTGGEETNIDFPFEDSSKVYKNLTVTNRLFMYPSSKLQLSGSVVSIDATTTFNPVVNTDFATYGSQTNAGFTRFSTALEANTLTSLNTAIAPGTLPLTSQAQQGLIRVATQTEANARTLANVALTPANLPNASETQVGATRFGTEAEVNLLALTNVAVSPANLPIASSIQQGLTQLATPEESNALTDTTKTITPGTQPIASETQLGLARYATDSEVDNFTDIAAALNPSSVKRLMRLLQKDDVGVCKLFAGQSAPDGYLLCQGQDVSREIYADLFNVIGIVWGDGDGVDTFTLPPAEKVFIAAGGTYVHGTTGGALANTVTSTSHLGHTHTNTVTLDGGHTPTGNANAGGGFTPVIEVIESGAHDHSIVALPGGGRPLTGRTLANDPVIPTIDTISPAGGHSHTVTVNPAGRHTHTGTVNAAGGYTPQIEVVEDGAHSHAAYNSDWGPYSFAGFNTLLAGAHTPTITTQFAGEHSHGGLANSGGGHIHSVQNGGNGALGGGSGNLQTDNPGDHTHFLQINVGGLHNHTVDVVPVADHFHILPTYTLPAHNHTITVPNSVTHAHDLVIEPVDAHQHTYTTSEYADHTHTNTVSTVLPHIHTITINEIDGHIHTVEIDALPNHGHTITYNNAPHVHELDITPVANHTHTLTMNAVDPHLHTVTVENGGAHDHNVTVSTVQPYAAMNVIIYTGVYD